MLRRLNASTAMAMPTVPEMRAFIGEQALRTDYAKLDAAKAGERCLGGFQVRWGLGLGFRDV